MTASVTAPMCAADESRRVDYDNGTVCYLDGAGQLHRADGPAVVGNDGTEEWWWHGTYHRDGGPAVVTTAGYRFFYRYGQLHREDGPALEGPHGVREWWRHGLAHRADGPALIRSNGRQAHRLFGHPATADLVAVITDVATGTGTHPDTVARLAAALPDADLDVVAATLRAALT